MSLLSRLSRRARITLATALGGALAVGSFTLVPSFATASPTQSAGRTVHAKAAAATMTPAQMLQRAATWLTAVDGHQVPYSQTTTFGGYRTDCSGYVSMALGLSKPGPNTVGLATNRGLTTPISLGSLKAGDLLIDADGSNTTRHVVIFEKWTSSAHTAYMAYEQRGGHGTDHRALSYGLSAGSEYKPYRPVKLGGSSTPTPPSSSYPTVQKGSSGVDVKAVQYLLTAHGYATTADGSFGSVTDSRVKAFQKAKGLVVDGVVGPKTWAKLITSVKSGSSGSAVRAVQAELNAHGYGLVVDGDFGPKTTAAVKSFQSKTSLVVDGLVGPKTWPVLLG